MSYHMSFKEGYVFLYTHLKKKKEKKKSISEKLGFSCALLLQTKYFSFLYLWKVKKVFS